MMRSFQCISEALISRLDRDEAKASAPTKVPPRAPVGTSSISFELKKVEFLELFGALDDAAIKA
jgi:hypothetical protein